MVDVSSTVREFYNRIPFPDYDLGRFKDRFDLEGAASPFARYLDETIPKSAFVIDVGCGTGQLCAYLSFSRKKVWGIDFSDGSLRKAEMLKKKLNLKSLTLRKEDILNLDLKEKFDYVICNGVLHHTSDPYAGFRNVLRLLKPGGYIIVGLYNRFGRKILETQRLLLHTLFSDNKTIRDAFLKPKIRYLGDKIRANAWYNDQFVHPHESTHTVAEVLEWFRKNNVEFINSAPPLGAFKDFSLEKYKMFEKQEINSRSSYIGTQLKWMITTGHDGGLWMMVGRKKK